MYLITIFLILISNYEFLNPSYSETVRRIIKDESINNTLNNQISKEVDFSKFDYRYLNNEELDHFVLKMSLTYRNLTRFYSIGQTPKNNTLHVLVVSSKPNDRPLLRPMVKLIANLHGNEALGRQLLVYLAQYLITNYDDNAAVRHILDSVELHFLFTANPDGFSLASEGDCLGSKTPSSGRLNSNNYDLDLDFPTIYDSNDKLDNIAARKQPETVALMSWIISHPFVLSGKVFIVCKKLFCYFYYLMRIEMVQSLKKKKILG